MRTRLIVALFFLASWVPAVSDVYDIAANQNLAKPVDAYQEAEAERLRQERMRLENERLRRESQRRQQEAQHREEERVKTQRDELEQDHSRAAASQQHGEGNGRTSEPNKYEQLGRLERLRDEGILTEEEYWELVERVLKSQ